MVHCLEMLISSPEREVFYVLSFLTISGPFSFALQLPDVSALIDLLHTSRTSAVCSHVHI